MSSLLMEWGWVEKKKNWLHIQCLIKCFFFFVARPVSFLPLLQYPLAFQRHVSELTTSTMSPVINRPLCLLAFAHGIGSSPLRHKWSRRWKDGWAFISLLKRNNSFGEPVDIRRRSKSQRTIEYKSTQYVETAMLLLHLGITLLVKEQDGREERFMGCPSCFMCVCMNSSRPLLTLPCKKFAGIRFIPWPGCGLHHGWNTDHK